MCNVISINLIFLFLQLFLYSLSIYYYDISNRLNVYVEGIDSSENFELSFEDKYDFDYLSIKIENQRVDYLGQISFLSLTDNSCVKERSQMSTNAYGDSILILKYSELPEKYNFFLCVKCIDENKCKYKIRFDQNYIVRMPLLNISYHLYTLGNYEEMSFGIRGEDHIKDLINEKKNHFEIFWMKRFYNNEFITYYNNKIPKDYNAVYLLRELNDTKRFIDFNISSYEGDFVQVGSSFIIDGLNYKPLNINDIETVGHLQREKLEEECFSFQIIEYYKYILDDFSLLFLYGHIYNKYAKTYFKKGSYKVNETEKEITDGIIFEILKYSDATKENYKFCVTFLESDKYNISNNLTFSIQFVSDTVKTYNYFFNSPQISEEMFPRFIKKGENMILSRIKSQNKSSIMSITANSLYGEPKMYLYNFNSFPFYKFSKDHLTTENKVNINLLKNYNSYFKVSYNPIDSNQSLLIINCSDAKYCIFDTTFFSQNEYVILKEGRPFSQVLSKENNNNFYVIDFEGYNNVSKIIITLFKFNSDDIQLIILNENIEITNYFSLEKNIYEINTIKLENQKIKFVIKSNNNTNFYSVKYSLIRDEKKELNKLKFLEITGINIIDNIDSINKNYKIIETQNSIYNQPFPSIINVYCPNCKLKILKNGQEVITYLNNKFYQEFLDNGNQIYNISIDQNKSPNDNSNLYINNIKIISYNNLEVKGTLLINDNIPQILRFENITSMKYIYPNIDPSRQTIIDFKLFNNAKYLIKIMDNSDNLIHTESYLSNKVIIINKEDYNCKENNECNLIIEVSLEENYFSDGTPSIEIVVRQKRNKFYYLGKEAIKEELIMGNNLYLYTNINLNDEGYITINFLKGKGEIEGKIVKVNDNINMDEEVNWDSIKAEVNIKYDFYTKKINFKKNETSKCQNGCYLLINVKAPIIIGVSNISYYPITILANLLKRSMNNLKKIKFDVNEYIIGSLSNNDFNEKDMFELYEFSLPYDVESIDIDCQSDLAKLLIFSEESLINTEVGEFNVEPGTILNIKREEFIKKYTFNTDSFFNTNILILVYAKKLDKDFTDILYSFKVNTLRKNELPINKVSNNQRVYCKPKEKDNQYRCLFMITFPELFLRDYLILYALSESNNAKVNIYGKYIEAKIYDEYNDKLLNQIIPNENSVYNTEGKNISYILLSDFEKDKYFYVSVISDSPSKIEFISHFYNYNNVQTPNPNIRQLYVLNKTLNNEIKINFSSQKPIMINIVPLYGRGELYINENQYNLGEENDLFSFSLSSDSDINIGIKNRGENLLSSLTEESSSISEEFIFYLEYSWRNSTMNLDKTIFGKNSEIYYTEADYPLTLYSEINRVDQDINIFFNFYNLTIKNKTLSFKVVKNKELDIYSKVIKSLSINDIIGFKDNENNDIKGSYDPAINVGEIYLSAEYINNIISTDSDKYIHLLGIEKNAENNNIIYEQIFMKTSFTKIISEIPTIENKYYYGKIYKEDKPNIYKLQYSRESVNKESDYICIQFSANSEIIDFNISDNNDNIEDYNITEENGKMILLIKKPNYTDYILFKVYMNNSLDIEENISKLNNYVFKYNMISDMDNQIKYKISNNYNKLNCTVYQKEGETTKIKMTYNTIENSDVIYSLKIVNIKNLIKGELYKTIAITESNSIVSQFRKNNSSNETINEIDIPIDIFNKYFAYIELIAQIIDNDNVEYIAYEPIKSLNEIIFINEENGSNIIKIMISILLIVLLLILIVVVYILYRRSKKDKRVTFVDKKLLKQVEMLAPIEYEDVLLDKEAPIN